MIRSKSPIQDVKLTLSDGTEVVFRRVPYLPDLFMSEEGHPLRLSQPSHALHNGRKSFRYGVSQLMTSVVMADTFIPGWDTVEGGMITFRDGNASNCALENLAIDDARPRRGRPPVNRWKRIFFGLQVLEACEDLAEAEDASEATREEILEACKTLHPALYEKVTGVPVKRPGRRPKRVGRTPGEEQKLDVIGEKN